MALSLAEKLEKQGKTGHITFIDGAPLLVKTLAQERYKINTDEAIQNSVIAHIFQNVFSNIDDDFVKDVFTQPTWNDKIERIIEFADSQKLYGKEYLKLMMHALVNRIKIILNTDIKICNVDSSTSTLIRPTTPSVANISENYDLDVNFKRKVDVIYLEGNHFTVLENPLLLEKLHELHFAIGK